VLESFLLDFPGCLIVVSHDRYFMDKIVDHLFVFRGDAVVEDFPGNYSDYRVYEDSKVIEERKEKASGKASSESTSEKKPSDLKAKLTYLEQKEHKNLEKDIQKLEKKKTEVQQKFADPELSGEDIDTLSIELQEIVDAIETKTERWFELSAMLEG
ncbi:MAG: ABC transporter ATP-binding protein, partial [Pricia sp.]